MQPIPLGRYLLTERLATGGTAEIYKAKLVGIEGFEKTVVVKRILPHWSSNINFIAMLVDEAKIMVRLGHERIAQVHELGKEGDTYYIVMEYVPGTDLRKFSERAKKLGAPLTPAESIFVILEVLRGLDYIHKQKDEQGRNLQIVHRDISPQNILLSTEGGIKITDFGIAHAASRSYETATGVLKGKFSYMSPEQARGGLLDPRTDLFATGIILFELLTGQRLFAGGADLEVLDRVKNFNVEEIFRHPQIDKPLKPILARALQPNLKDRYSNAHEFYKELAQAYRTLKYRCDSEELAERLTTVMGADLDAVQKTLKDDFHFERKDLPVPPLNKGALSNAIVSSGYLPGESVNEDPENTRSLGEENFQEPAKKKYSFLKNGSIVVGLLGLTAVAFLYFQNRKGPPPAVSSAPNIGTPAVFEAFRETIPRDESTLSAAQPETRGAAGEPTAEVTPAVVIESLKTKTPEEKRKEEKAERERGEKAEGEREKLLALKKSGPDKSEKQESAVKPEKAKNVTEAPLPTKAGQGTLSVRATPWGKISIAGVVSGTERPVSRSVPYGNYSVSVSYLSNLTGEWKTISRNVRVAKASTVCTASFRPDGQGSISCN